MAKGKKHPAMTSSTKKMKPTMIPVAMSGAANKTVGKTKPGMMNNNDQHSKSCSCAFCSSMNHK